jgi:hypothetical protein
MGVPEFIVGGQRYAAVTVGGGVWVVRWFKQGQADPVEAEVHVDTDDPLEAIRYAVDQRSWD